MGPCGWGRHSEGFHIEASAGKLSPGKMGSPCQAPPVPHPSRALASPAHSLARGPSLALLLTPLLFLLRLLHPPLCVGQLPPHSHQPVSAPPRVAPGVPLSSQPPEPGGDLHFSLPTNATLAHRTSASHFAYTSVRLPGSSYWEGPICSPHAEEPHSLP